MADDGGRRRRRREMDLTNSMMLMTCLKETIFTTKLGCLTQKKRKIHLKIEKNNFTNYFTKKREKHLMNYISHQPFVCSFFCVFFMMIFFFWFCFVLYS